MQSTGIKIGHRVLYLDPTLASYVLAFVVDSHKPRENEKGGTYDLICFDAIQHWNVQRAQPGPAAGQFLVIEDTL